MYHQKSLRPCQYAQSEADSFIHYGVTWRRTESGCKIGQGVCPLAVLVDLKMQVAPGGPPGLAHIADHLPGFDLLAGGNADGGTVCIQGFQAVTVVEFDVVAVAAAPAV